MIPVQMIVLVSIVMLYTASDPGTGPRLSAGGIIMGIVGTFAFVCLLVWNRTRKAVSELHAVPTSASYIAIRAERMLQSIRWITIGITAVQLWASGWGPLVVAHTDLGGWNLARFPAVAEIVLLLPPMLTWIILWGLYYRVEKAVHERSLPYRLAWGLPMHEMPTCAAYVFMQLRHHCFVLLPILGLDALSRGLDAVLPGMNSLVSLGVTIGLVLAGLLFLPTLIVNIWKTQPLTGPLRVRLEALANRYHLRYRNILVWQTHHFISNAAVLGYLPFSRYFLLSDALLESLSDQQIEAVFSHELGHVRHRHIWWYIVLIMAGAGIATSGSTFMTWIVAKSGAGISASTMDSVAMVSEAALLLAFLAFVFSAISRQFEHQADWFAAMHMAESLVSEPSNILTTEPADRNDVAPVMTAEQYIAGFMTPGGAPATAHHASRVIQLAAGAGVFASALGKIVSIANRSYDYGGWLHPSPRVREEFLMTLAADKQAIHKFNVRMHHIRLLIVILMAISIALAAGAAYLPTFKQNPGADRAGENHNNHVIEL